MPVQHEPNAAAASLHVWSTDAVPAREQLDYWVGAVCEAYFPVQCIADSRAAFSGRLSHVPHGRLAFSRMCASPQQITNKSFLQGVAADSAFLVTSLRHGWTISQDGVLTEVPAGDIAVIDMRKPYRSSFARGADLAAVKVPLQWVETAGRSRGCKVIAAGSGWGRILSTTCAQLGTQLELLPSAPPHFVEDQVQGLLAAIAAADGAAAPAPDLVGRAIALMRERLSETGLDVAGLAAALGVSTRTLHRAFASSGTSAAATLRQLRLEEAQAMLGNPRFGVLPVSEVARRCGFSTPSHFVREFQREFGAPPARWRLRQLAS